MKERRKISNKQIIAGLFSGITKTILLGLVFTCILFQLNTRTITPVRLAPQEDKIAEIKQDLQDLSANLSKKDLHEVSKSIKIASDVTKINDKIITSVAYYESRYNKNAKSSAGYRGIMQATTHDIYEFPEVDIMRGAKKLEQWIQYRKGNLRIALASYNGGTYPPPSSYDYANKVIHLAKKLESRRNQDT